ncbi:hypothetical protein DFJ74DRAFT_456591 [Hyaloraphidium curvatum]|nr:hypothetical protein DFJ74DRAFT_456591 [Hyaloraphidium curvatum]
MSELVANDVPPGVQVLPVDPSASVGSPGTSVGILVTSVAGTPAAATATTASLGPTGAASSALATTASPSSTSRPASTILGSSSASQTTTSSTVSTSSSKPASSASKTSSASSTRTSSVGFASSTASAVPTSTWASQTTATSHFTTVSGTATDLVTATATPSIVPSDAVSPLTYGVIIGIAAGGMLLLMAIAGLFLWHRSRRNKRSVTQPQMIEAPSYTPYTPARPVSYPAATPAPSPPPKEPQMSLEEIEAVRASLRIQTDVLSAFTVLQRNRESMFGQAPAQAHGFVALPSPQSAGFEHTQADAALPDLPPVVLPSAQAGTASFRYYKNNFATPQRSSSFIGSPHADTRHGLPSAAESYPGEDA